MALWVAIAAGTTAAAYAQSTSAPFEWNRVLSDPADLQSQLQADLKKIEQASTPADPAMGRARVALTTANWWLAVPTARPATRWLLGVATPADRKVLTDAAGRAAALVESARKALAAPASEPAGVTKQARRELDQTADMLGAFVTVFSLADSDSAAEPIRDAWRKAGRGLGIARESDDADCAAAARLWQAFALVQAGKRDRALETLPDALAKPERLPYDLVSRLLRCRLVADSGQYAAATTLLGRMEPVLKTWMTSQPTERNNARRLIAFLQYRIVQQWSKDLSASSHSDAAAPLEPVLKTIDDDFNEVKSPTIYYMSTAVPIKIAAPAPGEKPASAPAASKPAKPAKKRAAAHSDEE